MRDEHICDECFYNMDGSCQTLDIRQKTDHECVVCGESDVCFYYNQKPKKDLCRGVLYEY